eukprot:Skav214760  [mRNA]  locus=scaffold1230:96572:100261:- [translate_table: standard]
MFAPGDIFAAKANLSLVHEKRCALLADKHALWKHSLADPTKSLKFVHLFCGGFHGWAQAVGFIAQMFPHLRLEHSVSVDWDGNICNLAAANRNAKLILPPWRELDQKLDTDVVIACDIKSPVWLASIQEGQVIVWTVSFPCPPYSRAKGRGPGLEAEDGKPIIHVLSHAKRAQPCIILLENVCTFFDHPHSKLIFALAKWAGYRVIWMQKHDLASMTDASRSRWLGVMVRVDVRDEVFHHYFRPDMWKEQCVPWTNSRYQYVLPKSLADQLELDQHLTEIYGDPSLLPNGKKDKTVSHNNALEARVSIHDKPLSALVACYSKQHLLPDQTLATKGIFAEITVSDNKYAFHSPAMWASLLGNLSSLLMPDAIQPIFEQLGNAIAVPHAVMTICAALQATGFLDASQDLNQIVLRCWNSRLDAANSLCVQTTKGHAIVTPGDFLLSCTVDRVKVLAPRAEHDGACHILWPDEVQSIASYKIGEPLEALMRDLGSPTHVLHLWGFMSHEDDKLCFHSTPMNASYERGEFVFLPLMPANPCDVTVSEISSTAEWTALPCSPSPVKSRQSGPMEVCELIDCWIHFTIIMPDMQVFDIHCPPSHTCRQAIAQKTSLPHDLGDWELHASSGPIPWYTDVQMIAGSTLLVVTKPKEPKCTLEITMLDGSTKFATTDPQATIMETLIELNFHPKFVEKLTAIHNGLTMPMNTPVGQLQSPHVRLACFPMKGGTKSKGGGKGSNTAADPLQTNDPWKAPPPSNACRWDQLTLGKEHPVYDNEKGERMSQVPFLQIGPQKGGVAFATKSIVASLAALDPPTATVILLPGFKGLAGIQIPPNVKALAPQQVIVQEPQTGVQYKRLVLPLVVKGDIVFKMDSDSAIPVASTKFVELVLEAHPALLNQPLQHLFQEHPLEGFKKLLASSGISFQELSIYSYRKMQHNDGATIHQAILKAPAEKMHELLGFSGKHEVFIRQFLQQEDIADHSLLPRYWVLNHEEVRQAFQLGASLGEPFRGLAMTPKGVCIRACNKALAPARQLVLQGDVRFNESNRHVICRFTYIAQGYPFAISHACIIEATHKACGQHCIPLRSFRAGGLHTWVLGFGEHPNKLVFAVKVDDQIYEVMLTRQTNIRAMKPAKKPAFNKTKAKTSMQPQVPNTPVVTQMNMSQAESSYHALETRVSKLEVQQTALADKVDCGFTKMSQQLQQVLAAVSSDSSGHTRPRGQEPSGDTPPPKQRK